MDGNFSIEIKKKLKNLSHKQICFFAWICAIRSLPLLGTEGSFDYWKHNKKEDERQTNLLAVLNALDIASPFFKASADALADNAHASDVNNAVLAAALNVDPSPAAIASPAAFASSASADASWAADTADASASASVHAADAAAFAADTVATVHAAADAVHAADAAAFAADTVATVHAAAAAVHAAAAAAFAADTVATVHAADAVHAAAVHAAAAAALAAVNAVADADAMCLEVDFETQIFEDIEVIQTEKYDFRCGTETYGEIWGNFQKALFDLNCGYWGDWYAKLFAKGFLLDDEDKAEINSRTNVPVEISNQGAEAVAIYVMALKEQGAERLNEARVIILGEKGAGKTCLARRLIDPKAPMTSDDESTKGVETTLWKITEHAEGKKNKVNVHIWDFAGHVVTHAAHRCFLSERCLYIIVYDGRSERRNHLDYWLDQVTNYGGDSKAIVLVNVRDRHKLEIEENRLRRKYPFILTFSYIPINDDAEMESFSSSIATFIQNNPSWNRQELPALYYRMKTILLDQFQIGKQNQQHEIMTITTFNDTALRLGIKANELTRLLENLHALGICLWYKNLTNYNTLVLDPEWISHGIYNKLIDWAQDSRKYQITIQDYETIFSGMTSHYSKDQFLFLLDLMCENELAYKKAIAVNKETDRKDASTYVIPFLLNTDQPADLPSFWIDNSLMLEYALTTELPPDTISRFIVLRNAEIANEGKMAWRHGVILEVEQALALVIEEDRSIKVYVRGIKKTKYLSELRNTLNSIFDTYKSKKPELKYRILPPWTEDEYVLAPVDTLPVLSEKGIIAHIKNNHAYIDPDSERIIPLRITEINYNLTQYITGGENHMGDKITSTATGDGNVQVVGKKIETGDISTNVSKQAASKDIDSIVKQVLEALEKSEEGATTKANLKGLMLEAQTEIRKDPSPKTWEFWKGKIAAAVQFTSIGTFVLKLLEAVL